MPILILSDIHANLEALRAVLDDAQGLYDRILCLGDLVGYGADPNPVAEWCRANLGAVVRGNHDKACAGLDSMDDFNMAARKSAEWTRMALTPENQAYLERLPRGPVPYVTGADGFDLVHGSPMDEDTYLINGIDAAPLRPLLGARLTFFGHTHIQGGFLLPRNGALRIIPDGILEIEPDHFYLVNPGSVGQPRDGDPRAAYVLYSAEERVVDYRRVPYDIPTAAEKILAAGLPESLALRLYEGM